MNKKTIISFFILIFILSSFSFAYVLYKSKKNDFKKVEFKEEFFSQYQQDRWVYNNFFKNKAVGIFLDIGAHDGISFSNTYFFEKMLGWKGICIEPMPKIYAKLRKNRNCICINGGIAESESIQDFFQITGYAEMLSGFVDKYSQEHKRRAISEISQYGGSSEIIKVKTYKINKLLKKYKMKHIDFMSLDTEGGELEILKSINFKKYKIDIITVENNYHDNAIYKFLTSKGYEKVCSLGCDEIYKIKLK